MHLIPGRLSCLRPAVALAAVCAVALAVYTVAFAACAVALCCLPNLLYNSQGCVLELTVVCGCVNCFKLHELSLQEYSMRISSIDLTHYMHRPRARVIPIPCQGSLFDVPHHRTSGTASQLLPDWEVAKQTRTMPIQGGLPIPNPGWSSLLRRSSRSSCHSLLNSWYALFNFQVPVTKSYLRILLTPPQLLIRHPMR